MIERDLVKPFIFVCPRAHCSIASTRRGIYHEHTTRITTGRRKRALSPQHGVRSEEVIGGTFIALLGKSLLAIIVHVFSGRLFRIQRIPLTARPWRPEDPAWCRCRRNWGFAAAINRQPRQPRICNLIESRSSCLLCFSPCIMTRTILASDLRWVSKLWTPRALDASHRLVDLLQMPGICLTKSRIWMRSTSAAEF